MEKEKRRKLEFKLEFKLDKSLGYMYCYYPNHEFARSNGILFEHTYVVCSHLGRKLKKDEHIHHIDRNKLNNSLDNLLVVSPKEHTLIHMIEDYYLNKIGFIKSIDQLYKLNDELRFVERKCDYCGKIFSYEAGLKLLRKPKKFCSIKCSRLFNRKFDISKEELHKLVWSIPTLKIAKMFNVSDIAIGKRCKAYGINKPPRGYWAKQKT